MYKYEIMNGNSAPNTCIGVSVYVNIIVTY